MMIMQLSVNRILFASEYLPDFISNDLFSYSSELFTDILFPDQEYSYLQP